MIFFCLPFKFNLKSQELPHEALAAGTVVASTIVQKMTGQDVFGTVAARKRADLLLLEKNPLEDVANARKICGVMAAGKWFGRSAIEEMIVIRQ